MNVNNSITPEWISVRFSPVVASTQMEGTVSQIFDIGPIFYFMIKNGKPFVMFFITFIL